MNCAIRVVSIKGKSDVKNTAAMTLLVILTSSKKDDLWGSH